MFGGTKHLKRTYVQAPKCEWPSSVLKFLQQTESQCVLNDLYIKCFPTVTWSWILLSSANERMWQWEASQWSPEPTKASASPSFTFSPRKVASLSSSLPETNSEGWTQSNCFAENVACLVSSSVSSIVCDPVSIANLAEFIATHFRKLDILVYVVS